MQADFSLESYHYDLPEEAIAQHPADRRDQSRLLVLDRTSGTITHRTFAGISELLSAGDLLVVNNTKVFPARLHGRKDTGGKAEVFLLNYPVPHADASGTTESQRFRCEALLKSSRRPKPGSAITINAACTVTVIESRGRAAWLIELALPGGADLDQILRESGDIPLPPYINRKDGASAEDAGRYQTVYANRPGAVAAPTAGLHFTDALLAQVQSQGVGLAAITLHVGYGTFAPVEVENIRQHAIHREQIEISAETAAAINETRKRGGRIWAVGTTTVRALEYAAGDDGLLSSYIGWCDLYITPGFTFRVVDNLVTNFHLPRSSLMFLVAALCGREKLLASYHEAIKKGYRFYSYGDAMAIIA